MKFRQWYLGAAAAVAALIPLAANADPLPNLIAGAGPGDNLNLHFGGVTGEISANIGSGVNGGSCSAAGGLGTCLETTYGAGTIASVNDQSKPGQPVIWSGGPGPQTNNPLGTVLGFVIYAIADASVVPTGGTSESIDNTGATASGGKIHLDLYYMPGAAAPCFGTGVVGCTNLITAASVAGVTAPANSNVFGLSSLLFASFVTQPGTPPLTPNQVDDGVSNAHIQLTQTFDTGSRTGAGQLYATCAATPGPGCSQFRAVTEATQDATTGFAGDPAFAALIAEIFDAFETKTASTVSNNNQAAAGWNLQIKDPVNAFAAVPEPTSLALLGSALAAFGVAIGRRRRNGMSA